MVHFNNTNFVSMCVCASIHNKKNSLNQINAKDSSGSIFIKVQNEFHFMANKIKTTATTSKYSQIQTNQIKIKETAQLQKHLMQIKLFNCVSLFLYFTLQYKLAKTTIVGI